VNVASGEATPLGDVAAKLAAIAGARETGLGRGADRPNDPDLLVGSSERLRSTGWAPRIGLEEGLAATFDWWRGRERGP
jgi:nucleoside-diphosphate-sugar epimerase